MQEWPKVENRSRASVRGFLTTSTCWYTADMIDLLMNDLDARAFQRDGYIIKRRMVSAIQCQEMLEGAKDQLNQNLAPLEYEVDVQYPGSPPSRDAQGGETIRRLLHAYSRHEVYRQWATSPQLKDCLVTLFGADKVQLSQCHHNCIMTKQPGYSSATLWHQDNRYWSFDRENLISVWLALENETRANGCLRVIPGSHLLEPEPGRFDADLFLRPDLAENKIMIAGSRRVELQQGDVLFFHSRLLHAAGRNLTDRTKFSLVFTYHESHNHPIERTRSGRYPSVTL
jgi:phytanoyl-CoA hydroxylase